jgi:hypothetical protein
LTGLQAGLGWNSETSTDSEMALFLDRLLRRFEYCHHAIAGELKGPQVLLQDTNCSHSEVSGPTLHGAEAVARHRDQPSVRPAVFYIQTLKKPWSIADTPYPKKRHRPPAILSQEEIAQLIAAAEKQIAIGGIDESAIL